MHALLGKGGQGMVRAVRGRAGTHGKLVLGVDCPPAHRPGVVEPLHVVGFVKAARQEEAEAPGSTLAADAEPAWSCPVRTLTASAGLAESWLRRLEPGFPGQVIRG